MGLLPASNRWLLQTLRHLLDVIGILSISVDLWEVGPEALLVGGADGIVIVVGEMGGSRVA